MPNRILRDWTDSFKINDLDVYTERFFVRLIMKVDDFGRFSANPLLIKANLFPLKPDVRETDISRWLTECEKSGLIALYNVANKEYLQITDFRQRMRRQIAKYPPPDQIQSIDGQLTVNSQSIDGVKRSRREVEEESEKEKNVSGDKSPTHSPGEIAAFEKFLEWILANAPRVAKMKEPFTIEQFLKVKGKFPPEQVQELLKAMHNWEPLQKKNRSAFLTLTRWKKMEDDRKIKPSNEPAVNTDEYRKKRQQQEERARKLSQS